MRLLCPRYYTHSTAVLQLKSNILPKSCQTSEEGIWQMCRYSKVHLLQRSAVHYISKVQHDRVQCRTEGTGGTGGGHLSSFAVQFTLYQSGGKLCHITKCPLGFPNLLTALTCVLSLNCFFIVQSKFFRK